MKSRFLVIEDDPLVAMMLEDYLDALGHQTLGVIDNVAAALARIEAGGVDAAILDVHLANGETAEPVATALSARGIKFMIATGGFIAPPDSAFAGQTVLLKPFSISSLESALDEIAKAPDS